MTARPPPPQYPPCPNSHDPSIGASHLAIAGWRVPSPTQCGPPLPWDCETTIALPGIRCAGLGEGMATPAYLGSSLLRLEVQRALCAQLSTELGEPLQAPPLVNSSPHWSAASLPTAPQCSRLRLLIYCSAHEILMQERLAGGGAAPGLRDGGGGAPDKHPACSPRVRAA